MSAKARSRGFTLLEVLVTLVILSIGLLGLAGLQTFSLKNNHNAFQASQAVLRAYEIMDRMRANRVQAVAQAYDRNFADAIPTQSCSSTCTAAQMASADQQEWLLSLQRIGGVGSVSVDAAGLATVQVAWDHDRNPATTPEIFRLDTWL